jgi:CubicO group peptidase (beta-lactamase class C family)
VPAAGPITLRDLLRFTAGLGAVMAQPGTYPIQTAMAELGLSPSPEPLSFGPDEFMRHIGALPLIHQPGERWMYHTAIDILAVLIARVAGTSVDGFLRERIFVPLGMRDTGFSVTEAEIDRLATCYVRDGAGGLTVWDAARGGRYAQPPHFANALVSTVDDYLAFALMLLARGDGPAGRLLTPSAVVQMMSDQLTATLKAASPFFPGFWDNKGWGFGAAVIAGPDGIVPSPAPYSWSGGFGTTFVADPGKDMVAILFIQRVMGGPDDAGVNEDFLTLAYGAIED